MTLRKRLISGVVLLLVVFGVGATITVLVQRGYLQDQVDEQLQATPLPTRSQVGSGPPTPGLEREEPISGLYIASVEADQPPIVFVRGRRLTDTPDLSALLADPPTDRTLLTVPGKLGTSNFRVLAIPGSDDRTAMMVALPLDDVETTVRQLIYTLIIVAGLMTVVAAILASWVNRFGLKPISEMTAVADSIAAGDPTSRVESYGAGTEAGRLGNALNLMLDERDRAETKLRAFVSNASHELRTPLTSIRGYIDLYEQGAFREPEQLDDVVRRMRIESARMNLLVEELLLLAKLDEQRPLDLTDVDLSVLLHDVAASAKAAHPDRVINVVSKSGSSGVARADPLRLQQAVASLVDNAIAHTDSAVRLAAHVDSSKVALTVSDDGPGIPPDVAGRVFDRFYRGDRSRSRRSGGSGLGLSIAKSIAEAHGGSISVSTQVEEGATFTIEIPKNSQR